MNPPVPPPRHPSHRPCRPLPCSIAALASRSARGAAHGADPANSPAPSCSLNPYSTTLEAGQALSGQARYDAQLLGSVPSAQWFTKGTPDEVEAAADAVRGCRGSVGAHARTCRVQPAVPRLRAVLRGRGRWTRRPTRRGSTASSPASAIAPATVILEPDGLGIIPTTRPSRAPPNGASRRNSTPRRRRATVRAAELRRRCARRRCRRPRYTSTASHSGWLNVGDITDRLLKAGRRARRRLLPERLELPVHDESDALRHVDLVVHHRRRPNWARAPGDCANQYWNGGPSTGWQGSALTQLRRMELRCGRIRPQHSRNRGAIRVPARRHRAHDGLRDRHEPQRAGAVAGPRRRVLGCRGLVQPARSGPRRAADHRAPAIRWSMHTCGSRSLASRTASAIAAPVARSIPSEGWRTRPPGAWFGEQARELIDLARPALAAQDCHVVWTAKGCGQVVRRDGRRRRAVRAQWTLGFTWRDDQRVTKVARGEASQTGAVVDDRVDGIVCRRDGEGRADRAVAVHRSTESPARPTERTVARERGRMPHPASPRRRATRWNEDKITTTGRIHSAKKSSITQRPFVAHDDVLVAVLVVDGLVGLVALGVVAARVRLDGGHRDRGSDDLDLADRRLVVIDLAGEEPGFDVEGLAVGHLHDPERNCSVVVAR